MMFFILRLLCGTNTGSRTISLKLRVIWRRSTSAGDCSFPLKAYSSSVIEQALKGLKFVRTFEMRLKTNLTAGMTSCFSLRWALPCRAIVLIECENSAYNKDDGLKSVGKAK